MTDMNTQKLIPSLVIEQARSIKDLPFERVLLFDVNCKQIINSFDGTAERVVIPSDHEEFLFGNSTLHNHPPISCLSGLISSALPSAGDIVYGQIHGMLHFYTCDKKHISHVILPRRLEQSSILTALRMICFYPPDILEDMHEQTIELLYEMGGEIEVFDIETLEQVSLMNAMFTLHEEQ